MDGLVVVCILSPAVVRKLRLLMDHVIVSSDMKGGKLAGVQSVIKHTAHIQTTLRIERCQSTRIMPKKDGVEK
jgi:hypothetical protein